MKRTIKHLGSTFIVAIFLFIAYGSDDENATATAVSVETSEGTKSCLIDYDWIYPSGTNPISAFKFSSDGTFNSSTTMFGGMSTWGNWTVSSPGNIKLSYTKTSEGIIPADQILTMSSCGSLKVGSTVYTKE